MGAKVSRRRWLLFAPLTMLLGVLAALGIGEIYLRIKPAIPTTQIIRHNDLRTVGDVPVWRSNAAEELRHLTCPVKHPERRIIVFLGDSITVGSFLQPEEVFGQALEEHLNQMYPSPGFCIVNLAEAGYHFDQKLVVLQEFLAKHKPDLLMWQIWSTERFPYRMLGDGAYSVDDWILRSDGFPGIGPVPDVLNRALFKSSRLYQYLDISLQSRHRDQTDPVPGEKRFLAERMSKLLALVRERGLKLAFYFAPPLDRSFKDSAQEGAIGWQTNYAKALQSEGFGTYALQRELIGEDYQALRYDPCCHFNAAGHVVLARVFERLVLEQLGLPAR
jgi:hypothetical protein